MEEEQESKAILAKDITANVVPAKVIQRVPYCHHCTRYSHTENLREQDLIKCSNKRRKSDQDLLSGSRTNKKTKVRFCSKYYCVDCIRDHYAGLVNIIGHEKSTEWSCPFCRGLCNCRNCRHVAKKPRLSPNVIADQYLPLDKDLSEFTSITANLDKIKLLLNKSEFIILQFLLKRCSFGIHCMTSLSHFHKELQEWIVDKEEAEQEIKEYTVTFKEAFAKALACTSAWSSVFLSSRDFLYGMNVKPISLDHSLRMTIESQFGSANDDVTILDLSTIDLVSFKSVKQEWEKQEEWFHAWNRLLGWNISQSRWFPPLNYILYYTFVLSYLPNGSRWRFGQCTTNSWRGPLVKCVPVRIDGETILLTIQEWLYGLVLHQYEYWTDLNFKHSNDRQFSNVMTMCGFKNCVNPFCLVGYYMLVPLQIRAEIDMDTYKTKSSLPNWELTRWKKDWISSQIRSWVPAINLARSRYPQKNKTQRLLHINNSLLQSIILWLSSGIRTDLHYCTRNTYAGPRQHSPCLLVKDGVTKTAVNYISIIWFFLGYTVKMPILHNEQWHLDRTCAYPQCISPFCYQTIPETIAGATRQIEMRDSHLLNSSMAFRYTGCVPMQLIPDVKYYETLEINAQTSSSTSTSLVASVKQYQIDPINSLEVQLKRYQHINLFLQLTILKHNLEKCFTEVWPLNPNLDLNKNPRVKLEQTLETIIYPQLNFNPSSMPFIGINGPMQLQQLKSIYTKTVLSTELLTNIQIMESDHPEQLWPCWKSLHSKQIVNDQKHKIPLRIFICALTLKCWQLQWTHWFQECPCEANQALPNPKTFKSCCFVDLQWSCSGKLHGCIQPAHIVYTPISSRTVPLLLHGKPKSNISHERTDEVTMARYLLYTTLPEYGILCPRSQREFTLKERADLVNVGSIRPWTIQQIQECDTKWQCAVLLAANNESSSNNNTVAFRQLTKSLCLTQTVQEKQQAETITLNNHKWKDSFVLYLTQSFQLFYGNTELGRLMVSIAVAQALNVLNGLCTPRQSLCHMMKLSHCSSIYKYYQLCTIRRHGWDKNFPFSKEVSVRLKQKELLGLINLNCFNTSYVWLYHQKNQIQQIIPRLHLALTRNAASVHQLYSQFLQQAQISIDANCESRYYQILEEQLKLCNFRLSRKPLSPFVNTEYLVYTKNKPVRSYALFTFEHGIISLQLIFGYVLKEAQTLQYWTQIPSFCRSIMHSNAVMFTDIINRLNKGPNIYLNRVIESASVPYIKLLQPEIEMENWQVTKNLRFDETQLALSYVGELSSVTITSTEVAHNRLLVYFATKGWLQQQQQRRMVDSQSISDFPLLFWIQRAVEPLLRGENISLEHPWLPNLVTFVKHLARILNQEQTNIPAAFVGLNKCLSSLQIAKYWARYCFQISLSCNNNRCTLFEFTICSSQVRDLALDKLINQTRFRLSPFKDAMKKDDSLIAIRLSNSSITSLHMAHSITSAFVSRTNDSTRGSICDTLYIDQQLVSILNYNLLTECLMIEFLNSRLEHLAITVDPGICFDNSSIREFPSTPQVVDAFFSASDHVVFAAVQLIYAWVTWSFPTKGEWKNVLYSPNSREFSLYYKLPQLLQKMLRDTTVELSYNDAFGCPEDCNRPTYRYAKNKIPSISAPNDRYLFKILKVFLTCGQPSFMRDSDALYILKELEILLPDWASWQENINGAKNEDHIEWMKMMFFAASALTNLDETGRLKGSDFYETRPDSWDLGRLHTMPKTPLPYIKPTHALLWIAAHETTSKRLSQLIITSIACEPVSSPYRLPSRKYIPTSLAEKWLPTSDKIPTHCKSDSNMWPQLGWRSMNTEEMESSVKCMTDLVTVLECGFDHLYRNEWNVQDQKRKHWSIDMKTCCTFSFDPIRFHYPSAKINIESPTQTKLVYWNQWVPISVGAWYRHNDKNQIFRAEPGNEGLIEYMIDPLSFPNTINLDKSEWQTTLSI